MVISATRKYIHPTDLRQIIDTKCSTHVSAELQVFVSEDQKHISHVAKIKCKKPRSRDVAVMAKEALHPHFQTSETWHRWTTRRQPTSKQKKKMPQLGCRRKRSHFLAFSEEEDTFLFNGILHYGWGRWTRKLHDTSYHFHPNRTCQTRHQRSILYRLKPICIDTLRRQNCPVYKAYTQYL